MTTDFNTISSSPSSGLSQTDRANGGSPVTRGYREDIDWLRAIAVLSVVAFHFEAPAIYGGFVGVDIFFVISGFLITQILQAEIRAGTFSFAQFYERRVRRLLPALYVVVLVTTIPAFHYLLTSERVELFRSMAAVVSFTANVFFWLQSGYFDHAAVEKPLLHTWSLAVEEQFYLVLPLLIWGTLRLCGQARRGRIALPIVLVAAAVASFCFDVELLDSGRFATAFFMSPARAWEFLIGAIVAIDGLPVLRDVRAQRAARFIALLMMLIPIFSLRAGARSPGIQALTPCLGAALYLWCGIGVATEQRARYSAFRVIAFFGQISYSLYLWHWPLFTFARFSKISLTLTTADRLALFALAVALAYLSWAWVEQPFRRRTLLPTRHAAFAVAAAASACLLLASGAGILFGTALSGEDRNAARLDAYNDYGQLSYRAGSCFRLTDAPFDDAQCLAEVAGKRNVLLWGDSYAAHYYRGLLALIGERPVNLMQATQAGCMPTFEAAARTGPECKYFAEHMAGYFETHKPDLVLISSDWIEHARPPRLESMIADIRKTVAALNARGIPVILLGPAVQFKDRLPALLIRAQMRHIDPLPLRDLTLPGIFDLDARMKAALPASDKFTYVSVLDAVCPARECPVTAGDDVPLAWDYAHLTVEGSVHVVGKLGGQLGLQQLTVSPAPESGAVP